MVQLKKNVVFIRGLLRGNFHWKPFVDQLQLKSAPEAWPFSPIFIELAGCGDRHQEPSPSSANAAVEDLRSQLKIQLPAGGQFEICAISLGGMLAIHWAHLYPEEIKKLTIINSSWPGLSPRFDRINLRSLLKIVFTRWTSPHATEREILEATCWNSESISRYLTEYTLYAKDHPIKIMNLIRQLRLATSFPALSPIQTELQFVIGKNDQFVSPQCTRKLQSFLGGNIIEIDHCGHDLPMDRPGELIQILAGGTAL